MGHADLARRRHAAAADHAGVADGSGGVNGGRIVGSRLASMDLPVPGLSIITGTATSFQSLALLSAGALGRT